MADPLSSISGISSGIDFKALVDQIITLDRRPSVRMQATIDLNAKRKDALEQFRTALTTLKTASDALKDGTPFDAFSSTASGADVSGRNVLGAAASPTATPGNYSVQVTQLAQAQKSIASVGQTSASTALGLSGTLVVGGQNIVVAATDTLSGIRDKFNLVAGTSNVQATVLSVRADGTDQRLVLTGAKTGVANAFTVADDPANTPSLVAALGLGGAPQTVALDSNFAVDGVAMTRDGNSVGDAINGVTLTLSAVGTSSLAVERLKSAATAGVNTFVDAYNKLQEFVKKQSTTTGGPLVRDSMLRGTRASLADAMLQSAGPTVPADFAVLSEIGLSVGKDGTLSVDATKLQAVSSARLPDVRLLLADRMAALTAAADAAASPLTGQIDLRENGMVSQNSALQSHIDDLESRLDKKRSALLTQYAKFEATIGRLKSVGDAMGAQFAGLNKSTSNS